MFRIRCFLNVLTNILACVGSGEDEQLPSGLVQQPMLLQNFGFLVTTQTAGSVGGLQVRYLSQCVGCLSVGAQ